MKPFTYESGAVPRGYECSKCGKSGEKLWRQYNILASAVDLLCVACAGATTSSDGRVKGLDDGDQIGSLVPAIPTEDGETYWGYTSVPSMGCAWWYSLPPRAKPLEPAMREAREADARYEAAKVERQRQHDAEVARCTAEAVYVVRATDFERQCLWERYSSQARNNARERSGLAWEQIHSAAMETIGKIDGRPVCVTVFFARVEGRVVAFVDATSQVVDYKIVDEWIRRTFKGAQTTDAMNFHNCAAHIQYLNEVADAVE